MKTALKIILIFLITIILALKLAPVGGALHNSFWEYGGCGWWLPCDQGSQFEGFFYFYILLSSLLSFLLLSKKAAWLTFIIGSILLWAFIVYALITEGLRFELPESTGTLAIMLISFALGHSLALGIRKLIKIKATPTT